jgi:hypothetical protein
MRSLILAAALVAISSPTIAAPAATTSEAAVVRPSEAEALAFMRAYSPPDLRRQAELDILQKNFVPGLRKNPDSAALLDAFPALGPALTKAMSDQIDIYMAEYAERFYPRAADLVRSSLTKDEVRELTAFYSSASGRKMLAMAAQNIDASEVVDRAAKREKIDPGVMERQAFRTGIMAYAKLSEGERAQLLAMANSPAGQHLKSVMPGIRAIQTELMNNPGPRFRAASKTALAAAFKRVTGLDVGKAQQGQ